MKKFIIFIFAFCCIAIALLMLYVAIVTKAFIPLLCSLWFFGLSGFSKHIIDDIF